MKHSSLIFSLTLGVCLFGGACVQAQTDATRKPTPVPQVVAAPAEKGALRIVCEGENAGAEISINGVAKGRCPFDVEVAAGKVLLRAVKPINSEWERSQEEELTIGAGVARKVDVNVGYRRPTAETVKRWEAAANTGDAEAMYQLGWVYKWGTTRTIDFVKAASYFGRAAAAGHPAGTRAYAFALWAGQGVDINRSEYNRLQQKAADLGDGDALAHIGADMHHGLDRPQDKRKAMEYFLKAVAAGSTQATSYLVEAEPDKGKQAALERRQHEAFRRLADAGDMHAQYVLAYAHFRGDQALGIQRDRQKAAELSAPIFTYTLKAAATGDARSLVQLGDGYRDGVRGAPKDKFLAEQAYRAAIAKGSVEAKTKLDKLLAE